jgi:hypothetical protein
MAFELAQVNIGRLTAPVDSPVLAGFMAALDPVNAAAEQAPGFIWRLQTEDGNATAIQAFEWDAAGSAGVIVNMSVWTDAEHLGAFVYGEMRGLSDNGTVVVVKEPRGAVLAPLAVPMSLGAQPLCLGLRRPRSAKQHPLFDRRRCHPGQAGTVRPVPGCGPRPERAGVGRPAAGAVRLVEAGQSAGRGRWLHGDVAGLGVHYQGWPRRVAPAAGCLPVGHGASAGRRAGLAPVSRATSATSSSS